VATEIGIIKTLIGTAVATAADGSQRNLQAGDRVYQDEIITTGPAGAVEVEFTDGSVMTLGRSSQIVLDTETFNPLDVAQAPADAESEVDALQQALLEGADPTQIGDATAAGAGAGSSGNEGTDFVTVNYLAPEVTPTSGFDTTGISIEFPEIEEEVPGPEEDPEPVPTTGLTSISVDEDDLIGGEGNDQSGPVSYDVSNAFQSDTGLYLYDHNDQGNQDNAPGDDNAGAFAPTTITGVLNASFGTDGVGDITFNSTGQPVLTSEGAPVNYWVSEDGHTLIAYIETDHQNADPIFVAQITDPATGAFEFTLTGNLDHPDTTTEDNLLVDLTYTISDSDGDTAQGALTVDVDDDSPVIDNVWAEGEDANLEVVEASGSQGYDSTVFYVGVDIFPGADHRDNPLEYTFSLALTSDGSTSLVTTDGNHAITLVASPDGQTVTGQYEDGGTQTAFTVSVSGPRVRVVSDVALEHDNTQDGTEDNTLDINGLVNFVFAATATDSDGDTDVESTSTPLNISFRDTDPTLQFNEAATVDDLSVTEASLVGGQDSVTITAPTYTASAVDGYTDVVSYALALADGASSGLVTTVGNHAITLVVSGDGQTVTGQYNGSNVAFTVSIVGGEVVLTSNVALEHANGPQNTEDNTLDINGLLNLVSTVTVTDGDNDAIVGEHNSRTALNLEFVDTDPTLTVNNDISFSGELSVVEASYAGGSDSVTISGPTYTDSAVDGYNTTVSYALVTNFGAPATGLTTSDVAGGEYAISLLEVDANTVIGVYTDGSGDEQVAFTISLSGNSVTLTSFVALEHSNAPQGAGEDNSLDLAELVSVTATVTTTDGDGDVVEDSTTAATQLSLTITDTNPSITVTKTADADALTVDETDLTANASANFADNFSIHLTSGPDGASVSSAFTLSVVAGTDSGLVDVATGNSVYIFLESGVVVGREGTDATDAATGDSVFTVSVNASGSVNLDQVRALDHGDDSNDHDSTVSLSADAITLTRTVTATDADGDTATDSDTIAIGTNLNFKDDGPDSSLNATAVANAKSSPIALVVDETDGVQAPADNAGDRVSKADFSGLFADVDGSVDGSGDYGTDGAGSVAYALSLVYVSDGSDRNTSIEPMHSGLYTLGINGAQGTNILLSNNAGVIEGKVGATVYFTISVDSAGEVTFTQNSSNIWHSNTGDANDASSLSLRAIEGHVDIAIRLTQTVTDADGDTDSAFVDLASSDDAANVADFSVLDDGPNAAIDDTEGSVTVDESAGLQDDDTNSTSVVALFAGVSNVSTDLAAAQYAVSASSLVTTAGSGAGTDEEGASTVLSLSVTGGDGAGSGLETTGGTQIFLYKENGLVIGRIGDINGDAAFAITLNTDGTVNVAQYASITNPTGGASHDETVNLTGEIDVVVTVTDGDGDVDTDSVAIGDQIFFSDDGPSITVTKTANADAITVDETDLTTNASANFADNFSSTSSYGADGAGSVSSAYTLNVVTGTDSGLVDVATGNSVYLFLESGVVVGREGTDAADAATGDSVFTVSVNASGSVSLDQVRALDHGDDSNNHDSTVSLSSDAITLTRTDTVTDGDGDTNTGSDTIAIGTNLNFKDDGPDSSLNATAVADVKTTPIALVVDETDGVQAPADNVSDRVSKADFSGLFASVTGTVDGSGDYGTDGAGSVGYALGLINVDTSATLTTLGSGLFALGINGAQGAEIVLSNNAGVIEGKVNSTVYFTISVDGTGAVTFTQNSSNIWHSNTGDDNDASSLSLSEISAGVDAALRLTQTVTDADGDTDSAFVDLASSDAAANVADFSVLDDGPSISVTAIADADALTVDETDLASNDSANFADNFTNLPNYGTDGAGSVSSAYALDVYSGTDSGLVDVATGNNVYIFLQSGVVVGREGTSASDAGTGNRVFTVSVNVSGTVTLDQIRAINHGDDSNDHDASLSLGSDAITLIRTDTITDGDGDTATDRDTIAIGKNLNFKDDGPDASLNADAVANAKAAPIALVVDETDGVQTPADNVSDRVSKADMSGLFASVTGTVDGSGDYGTDGAGSVAYALSLVNVNSEAGLATLGSGLYAIDSGDLVAADGDGVYQGAQIMLTIRPDGVIEGKVNSTVYFTISVDGTGAVTFTQNSSNIWHDNTGDANDASSLSLSEIASGIDAALRLTQTVTDADGDTDSAYVDLASSDTAVDVAAFSVLDDGPSITVTANVAADALTVDETVLAANDSANFADNFSSTPSYGTDGAGSVSTAYALSVVAGTDSGLDDVATGNSVYLFLESGVVVGREGTDATDAATGDSVFTVSVNASGTVTLDQIRALDHGDDSNDHDSSLSLSSDAITLTRTDTITDGDGDTNTGSDTITIGTNLNFEDDGPTAVADTGDVDEGALLTVLAANGVLADDTSGTDGWTATNAGVVGVVAGSDTSTDTENGLASIETTYGTLTLAADGSYTYQAKANVVTDDSTTDTFVYTVKDGDGDLTSTTLTISLANVAEPEAGAPITLTVDDQNLANGSTPAGPDFDSDSIVFTPGSNAFASIVFGTDLSSLVGGLTWVRVSDTQITGSDGSDLIVTLDLSVTGTTASVTATLSDNYDSHPTFTLDDLQALGSVDVVGTDTGGTTVAGTVNVQVSDDIPVAFTPETASLLNIKGSSTDLDIDFEEAAGADGVGNVVFTTTDGTQLFDSDGKAITFEGQDVYLYNKSAGNVIEGRTSDAGENSGDLAFTATLIPGTDTYSIGLEGPLSNNPAFSFSATGGIGGGNTNFYALGIGSGSEHDVLVSGNNKTVNSSQGKIGIGTGQDVGSGDVARFDMVKNIVSADGSTASHDGHYAISKFIQQVTSVQGNANQKTKFFVTIRTGDDDDTYFGDNTGESHSGNITYTVYNGDPASGGTVVKTETKPGNSVEVKDVKQGYFVEISSTNEFSIVEYAHKNNEAPFKLGDMRVEAANDDNDFDFELPVQGIDGDGDTIDSNLTVELEAVSKLAGGDIDVDTYVYDGNGGRTNVHEHAYDTKGDYTGVVDTFDFISKPAFAEIDTAVTEDYFVLVVVNGHRNAGANILIDTVGDSLQSIDAYLYGGGTGIYGGGDGFDEQIYTFDSAKAINGVKELEGLKISYESNAIVDEFGNMTFGARYGDTGDVNTGLHGKDGTTPAGEHRDGALSIMAVKVTKESDGSFTLPVMEYKSIADEPGKDFDNTPFIFGVDDQSDLLWETTVFAHTSGEDPRTEDQYKFNQDESGTPLDYGIFVDGIVVGLDYQTSSGFSGRTDASGAFNYANGDMISFSIGSVLLGTVSADAMADGKLFLQEIAGVGLEDINNDYVENMAVLLQSIDNDDDAYNGIVIEDSVHTAFSDDEFDLATISKADLQEVLEKNGYEPVDEDEAMQHVRDMITEHAGLTEFDDRESEGSNLIASEGDDIFAITIDEGDDAPADVTIVGFGESGHDALDLTDLLAGESIDNLNDYLDISFADGDTTIVADIDGTAAGTTTQTIVLQGVDLMAGGTLTSAEVVDDLLSSQTLIVD
jgi:T1SS-143 domain-containing protein